MGPIGDHSPARASSCNVFFTLFCYSKHMTIHDPIRPLFFSFTTDFHAGLIRCKFTKLWDAETLRTYQEAAIVEMKKFRDAGRPFDAIGDISEFPPQPQFLNKMRETWATTARDMGMRKCALVAAKPIVKLQIDRLSEKSFAFFTCEEEALSWIREK